MSAAAARNESDCAGCMATVLTRIDDLRKEIKSDLHDATTPVWQEIKALGQRVSTVESTQAQQQGGSKVWAIVAGAIFGVATTTFGAWIGGKF